MKLLFFLIALTFNFQSFAQKAPTGGDGKVKKVSDSGYATNNAGQKINWTKIKCKLDPNCKWIDHKF